MDGPTALVTLILDEALDRVDALEAEVASLRAEVDRLRVVPGRRAPRGP